VGFFAWLLGRSLAGSGLDAREKGAGEPFGKSGSPAPFSYRTPKSAVQ
jgi:hypothetical protein